MEDKPAALSWLVKEVIPAGQPTLLFVSTKHHVQHVALLLEQQGVQAACIYGSMDQVASYPHPHSDLSSHTGASAA